MEYKVRGKSGLRKTDDVLHAGKFRAPPLGKYRKPVPPLVMARNILQFFSCSKNRRFDLKKGIYRCLFCQVKMANQYLT